MYAYFDDIESGSGLFPPSASGDPSSGDDVWYRTPKWYVIVASAIGFLALCSMVYTVYRLFRNHRRSGFSRQTLISGNSRAEPGVLRLGT